MSANQLIWLTTQQAADHTARHPVTVRKALEASELHGGQAKTKGRWRIHIDCLDAWVLGDPCPHASPASKTA